MTWLFSGRASPRALSVAALALGAVLGASGVQAGENLNQKYGADWTCGRITANTPETDAMRTACEACEKAGKEFIKDDGGQHQCGGSLNRAGDEEDKKKSASKPKPRRARAEPEPAVQRCETTGNVRKCYKVFGGGALCELQTTTYYRGDNNSVWPSQETEFPSRCPEDLENEFFKRFGSKVQPIAARPEPAPQASLDQEPIGNTCRTILREYLNAAKRGQRSQATEKYALLQAQCPENLSVLSRVSGLRLPERHMGERSRRMFGAAMNATSSAEAMDAILAGRQEQPQFDAAEVMSFALGIATFAGQMYLNTRVSAPAAAPAMPTGGRINSVPQGTYQAPRQSDITGTRR